MGPCAGGISSFGLNESRRRDLVSIPLQAEDPVLEMVDFVLVESLVTVNGLAEEGKVDDFETFAADEKDLKKEQLAVVKPLFEGTALEGESRFILDDVSMSMDFDICR